MRPLTRRRFLGLAAGATVAPIALRHPVVGARAVRRKLEFRHGVASGDPLHDRVVLWTRVTGAAGDFDVRWEVADDPSFRRIVTDGTARTGPDRDHTVKVDAAGLEPGRTYWYRFRAPGGVRSPIGRTKTPARDRVESARFAVVTCADYNRGLFSAYGRVAERDDLDAVIHLGDYLYEHGRQDRVRPHVPPRELRTVDDYRQRYASYRLDPNLAGVHAAHPMIWVWDDHETCDGAWKGGADPTNHDPTGIEDGPWEVRKAAALQAALEWLPVRTVDPSQPERLYRRFAWGDLVDLFVVDTRRIGRDEPLTGNVPETDFFTRTPEYTEPSRQLLGADQEAWLAEGLTSSRARWKLLGNQVVLSPIKVVPAPNATGAAVFANPDQWDGYPAAQDRMFDVLEAVDDVVVVTGDVHASFAFEVTRDANDPTSYDPVTGRGALAVELVAPSVSSAGDPPPLGIPDDVDDAVELLASRNGDALRLANPHLKYVRTQLNGHLLVDIDRDRVRAEWWLVPTVTQPTGAQTLDKVFVVHAGSSRLTEELPLRLS